MSIESGVIEAVRLERIEDVKLAGDLSRYQFRSERPARWLQRLCFWILGKLGAYADLHAVTIERHVIGKHGDSFMKRLVEQKIELLRAGHEPTEVLMGAEDYAGLMGEATSFQSFEFDARYFTGGKDGRKVHGLRVKVIPWMRGLLVMP